MKTLRSAAIALAALSATARADFTISGEARYVDRAFTFGGGFTGSEPELPIRAARVQVLTSPTNAVLATGMTADDGTFAFVVPGSGTADVFVRVRSVSDAFGSNLLRSTDASNQFYDLLSPVSVGHDLGTNLDVGILVSDIVVAAGEQGNPFNVLDQMLSALDYITSLGAPPPSSSLRLTWPGGGSSFASGNSAWIGDDDGYDDLVILHEFGHVVHEHWSDSDNPGGSHFFGDSDQDPRLSLGEGYASFFAGAVRQFTGVFDPGFYMDCDGSGGTGGGTIQLRMRMENASPWSGIGGEADEGAIFCALWDVVDTTSTNDGGVTDDDLLDGSLVFTGGIDGDQLLWSTLVGPVNGAPNLTIRDFWNGFFVPVDKGQIGALSDVLRDWKMRFFADNGEPDNSLLTAFAVTPSSTWSGLRTLYWSAATPPAPGDGDLDFYAFTLCTGAVFDVETRYHNGVSDAETYADTFLTLRRPDGTIHSLTDTGGAGLNAALQGVTADANGTWTAEVKSVHSYRRTGSYQFRVRITTAAPGLCPCCPLNGNVAAISVSLGGTQSLTLDAGPSQASKLYWVFGSVTGTSPGLPTDLGTFPLNIDGYFLFTLNNPNLVPLSASLGVLDANGRAAAAFFLPPGTDPSLAGITFNHAYLVFGFDGVGFVLDFQSNAVPVVTGF